MNEQKKCPFCGSGYPGVFTNGTAYCSSPTCSATAGSLEAWNTRAAPTMKPWVWVHHGPPCGYSMESDLVELTYKAVVNSDDAGYWATVDERVMTRTIEHPIGSSTGYMYFDSEADAQAACVAYVERKLKEWLI